MSNFNPDDDTPMDLPPAPTAAGGDKPADKAAGDKKALPPTPGKADDKAKALPATPADGKASAAAADDKKWVGTCLCKKVKVTVTGLPAFSGFCHCTICSKHGGTDRGLTAGWAKDKVVVEGKEFVGSFASSDRVTRTFCKTCGTGVGNETPQFTAVSPAIFSDGDTFRVPKELAPTSHIFYGSSCLLGHIKDGSGLPLFKDTPKPMGGTGDLIKE